jgi:hypothetical protein
VSKIAAYIRNNETGEVRVDEYETEDQYAEGQVFWWQEGNACCDCNREIFFRRAAGLPEPDDDYDELCGDTRFGVEFITIDGVRHEIDAAAPEYRRSLRTAKPGADHE